MIRPFSRVVLASAIAVSNPLTAQSETATATLTYGVREINEIGLSGEPRPLFVTRASPGVAPADAIDAATTWMSPRTTPAAKSPADSIPSSRRGSPWQSS